MCVLYYIIYIYIYIYIYIMYDMSKYHMLKTYIKHKKT